MKANELRIGNYYLSFGVDLKQVEILHKDKILIDFQPIPLTEEWLLKFGFSLMKDTTPYNYRIHKSKMFFYIRYGSFTTDGGKTDLIGFNGLFIANKFTRVIKYVHELQNIYFALTGEELTFKSE